MDLTRQKILIVDDNSLNLQLLGKLLAEHGYNALIATSVQQAISIAGAKKPDLIITDIMMPEIDGRQLCIMLKSNPDTAHIPVIFISATSDTEIINSTFAAGGTDFVSKPFKTEQLLHVVNRNLNPGLPVTENQTKPVADTAQRSGSLMDTALLDALTKEDHELKAKVIRDFHRSCRKVETLLEGIIRRGMPVNTVLQDLHRLANLCPYLANKCVSDEIRKFEKLLRSGEPVPNQEAISFISMLCCIEDDLRNAK